MGSIHIQPNADALKLALTRKKEKIEKPVLLTIAEASDFLRVSRHTIYRLLNARTIPSVRILSRRLVPLDALEDFIAREVEEAI
jgi:excisionase family DNA binding protein